MINWDEVLQKRDTSHMHNDFEPEFKTFYQCFFKLLDTGVTQHLIYYIDYNQKCDSEISLDYYDCDEHVIVGDYPLQEEDFLVNNSDPPSLDHSGTSYENYDWDDHYDGTFVLFDLAFDRYDPIYKFRTRAEKLGLVTETRRFSDWYESLYRICEDENSDVYGEEDDISEKEMKLYDEFNKFIEKEICYYCDDIVIIREGYEPNPTIIKKPNVPGVKTPKNKSSRQSSLQKTYDKLMGK